MVFFFFSFINKVSKEGLIEKVTFEQRRQGGEGLSQMALWGKRIPARGISQGNGLEQGAGSRERASHGQGIARRPAWLEGSEGGGGSSR